MNIRRTLVLPLVASVCAFYAFLRTPGADNVRTVQMIALIATGMGLGVALAHLKLVFGLKSDK
jgi:hypothetical protein